MTTETQPVTFEGSSIDALATILHLAITAPDDEKTDKAIRLADQLASRMSADDVEKAKAAALSRLE